MLEPMATPRSLLIDPVHPMAYHLVSRCVRRSWLCGLDPLTGIDYSHRKENLERRIVHLALAFPVELWAFCIMSNHFHLALLFHPTLHLTWSDEEVVRRWLHAFPPKAPPESFQTELDLAAELLLQDPERLAHCRHRLGSLSTYMQHIKQPFAFQCNREDGVKGHFFEQRFYSGAILDEAALLTTMTYIDLNPVRAGIADTLEQCAHTAALHRLNVVKNTPERLEQAIAPIASGLASETNPEGASDILATAAAAEVDGEPVEPTETEVTADATSDTDTVTETSDTDKNAAPPPTASPSTSPYLRPRLTEKMYQQHLRDIIRAERPPPGEAGPAPPDVLLWMARLRTLGKPQRAHGGAEALDDWLSARRFRPLEASLP